VVISCFKRTNEQSCCVIRELYVHRADHGKQFTGAPGDEHRLRGGIDLFLQNDEACGSRQKNRKYYLCEMRSHAIYWWQPNGSIQRGRPEKLGVIETFVGRPPLQSLDAFLVKESRHHFWYLMDYITNIAANPL
jgi:hypothetical protein